MDIIVIGLGCALVCFYTIYSMKDWGIEVNIELDELDKDSVL